MIMGFTNINTYSILIFSISFLLAAFLIYKYSKKVKSNLLLSKEIKENKISWFLLLILSLLFLVINVLWIKWDSTDWKQSWGSNILFLLDVSKSMNVKDVYYNSSNISRIELSKKFILDYISKNPNNNYWLSVFAWEYIRILPFTKDYSIFETFLLWVDENNVTKFWSKYENAVNNSLSAFDGSDEKWFVILLTDISDDINDFKIEKNNNISFFIVWVWSETWWYIPIWRDFVWNIRYKFYNWKRVLSSININSINKLSNILESENIILNDFKDFWDIISLINDKFGITFDNVSLDDKFDNTRIILILSLFLFVFSIFYLWRKK